MRLVVTREDYFEAAMAILGEEGHGALKINALCRRIGVTTGSFYNYFGSLRGFVADLLLFWERDQTERLVELALVETDARGRISALRQLALAEVRHAAEGAIRAWANVNEDVAAAQGRVDDMRLQAMRQMYTELIPSKREVSLLAEMGLSLLVGHQALRPSDNRGLTQMFDEYQKVVFAHADAADARESTRQAG